MTTYGGFPAGGCVLRDKTTCTLPYVTCCDHGRAIRWPRCTCLLGCNAPWQTPQECPLHSARLAAENTPEDS